MDPYRAQAMRVVLEVIDRFPGEYVTSQKRTPMLEDLIGQHDLKGLYGSRGKKGGELRGLNPESFNRHIADVMRLHKTQKEHQLPQFFEHGSDALSDEYLASIGYERKAQAPEPTSMPSAESAAPSTRTGVINIEDDSIRSGPVEKSSKESRPEQSRQSPVRDLSRTQARITGVKRTHVETSLDDSNEASQPPRKKINASATSFPATTSPPKRKRRNDVFDDISASNIQAQKRRKVAVDSNLGTSTATSRNKRKYEEFETEESEVDESEDELQSQPPLKKTARSSATAAQPTAARAKEQSASGDLPTTSAPAPVTAGSTHSERPAAQVAPPQYRSIAEVIQSDPNGPWHNDILKLGNSDVDSRLMTIMLNGVNVALSIFDKCEVSGEELAEWVAHPSKELEGLYVGLFGAEWREHTAILRLTHEMNAWKLVEGLVAVAVHEWVLKKDVPWPGPRDILKGMEASVQLTAYNRSFKICMPLLTYCCKVLC